MFFGLRSYCFLICVLMVSSARAGFILNIDLSTVNQVTISATTAVSLVSVSGNDYNGVYLKDIFAAGALGYFDRSPIVGSSLVYFNATSNGSPGLYHDSSNDRGLNIYDMDNGTPSPASFTTGVQAFKGSATWSLTASQYAVFLLAPKTGDVYAFAFEINDLNGGPKVIGQYDVSGISAVPEPTSVAIFGLGGLGMVYLARRKRKV